MRRLLPIFAVTTTIATIALGFAPQFVSEADAASNVQLEAALDCTITARYVGGTPPGLITISDGDQIPHASQIVIGAAVANLGPNAANGLTNTLLVQGDYRSVKFRDEEYTTNLSNGGTWYAPGLTISSSQSSYQDEITIELEADIDDEFYSAIPGSPPPSESCSLSFTLAP